MIHRFWRYRLRAEKESVRFLLEQNLEGSTLIDIGANKGIYTYWLSKKAGKNGKVFSFEAQPELEDHLIEVKKAFHLTNTRIESVGLSSEQGKSYIYRSKIGAGGASIEKQFSNDSKELENLEKIGIELTTLDIFAKNNNLQNLSFIKCDVEGHEFSVFKGAKETLKQYTPTLLFECYHDEAASGEIFNFLTALGYSGFFIAGGEKHHFSKFNDYKYPRSDNHRNYIFMRKDKMPELSA
ncbi:FkbM family methyltransferase [Fulvivirga sp. M361]|uniref:FkbM family methyltransferase n=1 Tax=Fulvivirga sp. M361 TaxID=2594266 RepID=UPI0016245172|nr:FkbM family methyltransferase [Fulvivirga sp. M361]